MPTCTYESRINFLDDRHVEMFRRPVWSFTREITGKVSRSALGFGYGIARGDSLPLHFIRYRLRSPVLGYTETASALPADQVDLARVVK